MVFFSGCTSFEDKLTPKDKCLLHCKVWVQQGDDMSKGPCISDNNSGWDEPDWVCDVAHQPRKEVDNEPENQCQAYRNNEARHFVEVDTDCDFIRQQ